MITQTVNTSGETIQINGRYVLVSLDATRQWFGATTSMYPIMGREVVIDVIRETLTNHCGCQLSRSSAGSAIGCTFHVDDFSAKPSRREKDAVYQVDDVPASLVKWSTLDHRYYRRQYRNCYGFFRNVTNPGSPPPREVLPGWYHREDYSERWQTILVSSAICYGGVRRKHRMFRETYRDQPTHTFHHVGPPATYVLKATPTDGTPIVPTLDHLKEAMENFKRGQMIPKYWDLDEIFDKKYHSLHFVINLEKITKERWYWYASMVRYLGENPRLLHAFNGMCKDIKGMHPILALAISAAMYASPSNAAVECRGLFSVSNKDWYKERIVFVNTRGLAEYVTRVAKFLGKMNKGKLILEENMEYPMWRLFRMFRTQTYMSPEEAKTFLIPVRVPKASYESLENLLGYNPFTRKVIKYEGS